MLYIRSMKFAVAVIARNESKTLPRLVDSLRRQKFTGHIYVLDTGSTDGTADVARNLGCIVYEYGDSFRFTLDAHDARRINAKLAEKYDVVDVNCVKEGDTYFNFAEARNEILNEVKERFVFMPDCDEFVTAAFDPEYFERLIDQDFGISRFSYDFCYSRNANGSPQYQFTHHKFFDKTQWQWKGVVHEELVPCPGVTPGPTHYTNEVLLEHQQNPESNRSGYLTGMIIDLVDETIDIRTKHYLGRELMFTEDRDLGFAILEEHANSPDAWNREAAESYLMMSTHPTFGNSTHILFAIELDPMRKEPWLAMIKYLFAQNRHAEAAPFIEAFKRASDNSFYRSNQYTYSLSAYLEILYVYEWYAGSKKQSEEILHELIEENGVERYRADLSFYPDLEKEFN